MGGIVRVCGKHLVHQTRIRFDRGWEHRKEPAHSVVKGSDHRRGQRPPGTDPLAVELIEKLEFQPLKLSMKNIKGSNRDFYELMKRCRKDATIASNTLFYYYDAGWTSFHGMAFFFSQPGSVDGWWEVIKGLGLEDTFNKAPWNRPRRWISSPRKPERCPVSGQPISMIPTSERPFSPEWQCWCAERIDAVGAKLASTTSWGSLQISNWT